MEVPNLYGDLTLMDRDPTKPNDAFFKNVDYVVNKANELGLVMGLVTLLMGNTCGRFEPGNRSSIPPTPMSTESFWLVGIRIIA